MDPTQQNLLYLPFLNSKSLYERNEQDLIGVQKYTKYLQVCINSILINLLEILTLIDFLQIFQIIL